MTIRFVQDSLHGHMRRYGQMPLRLGVKVGDWVPLLREFYSHSSGIPLLATPKLVPFVFMGVEIYPVSLHGVHLTEQQALQEYVATTRPIIAGLPVNPLNSISTYVTVDIGPYRYAVLPNRVSYTKPANQSGPPPSTATPTRFAEPLLAGKTEAEWDRLAEVEAVKRIAAEEPPCHCRSASEHEPDCGYIKWKRSRK